MTENFLNLMNNKVKDSKSFTNHKQDNKTIPKYIRGKLLKTQARKKILKTAR